MRGEGSGTERFELVYLDCRGCIEFIRILLGLALAEDVDLGQNPDVELSDDTRTCEVKNVIHHSVPSSGPSSATASRAPRTANVDPVAVSSSGVAVSKAASDVLPISPRTRSASAPSKALPVSSRTRNALPARLQHPISTSSASSKRVYSEIGDDNRQEMRPKKRKIAETVFTQEEWVVFFPLRVYGYTCLGILFTFSSIRERGTTVFCVPDLNDEKQRLALKMSRQDLERVADQVVVMERLKDNPHPNVIVPLEYVVSSDLGTVY